MAATAKKVAGVREEIAERRQKVFELRKSGATVDQISQRLGIPRSTVGKDIKDVLKLLQKEQISDAAHWRELDVQQTDMALLAIVKLVQAGHLGAIDRWNRLLEHRARVLGYAAQPENALNNGQPLQIKVVYDRNENDDSGKR